jgi:tetratricopeptide (TPR) repeat protein
VLWCLAVLAYANSFRAGLIYDNQFVLVKDSRIRQVTEENLHLILTKDYWYKNSVSTLYRPLTTLSYLFNHAVLGNGDAPAGYHAVNLALHAANIALVYLLGWLVLAEFWPAFAMAALWAVHPVLTESVTNVVGRADLLAAFGVLAGLLCYARGVAAVRRRAILWQAGVLAASAIAIFSKESGIVIIAAIFLYDIAWCRQAPLRARIAGYLAAAVPIVLFLAVRAQVINGTPVEVIGFTDNPLTGADFWTGRLTAVKVLGKYLWLLFWPARLSCDYSFNQIPLFSWNLGRWEDWQALIALAVYAAAAALAVLSYRRSRPVFFLIGFLFAAMVPTANIFLLIGTIMAERLLYLPSVAFAGCLAWAGWNLYRRLQPWLAARLAAPALLTIVCLALGGRTFARNFDWYDEGALWKSSERVCPQSYRPHQHVANWLANPPAKDFDNAEREAERAVAILQPLPDLDKVPLVYATAGFCYRARGEELGPNGAVWYRKALDALLEGVRVDDTENREFGRLNALAGKPAGASHVVPLYLELARTYRALGQYREAIDALTTASWADPQAEFFEELSKIYKAEGDAPQAVVALLEGITMGVTDQVRLAAEVVDTYKQTAPESCALTGSGNGAAINFGCPMVHEQLCLASRKVAILYHRMQRDRDAAAIAAGAVSSLGCPAGMFR